MVKQTKTYEVTPEGAGWLDGKFRKAGDTVEMTPDQAKFLLLNGQLKERVAKPVPKPTPSQPASASALAPAPASAQIQPKSDGKAAAKSK